MKYTNANDVLPEELISMIKKYYQGGYLYIPKEPADRAAPQTEYRLELRKRNQQIYLKHLEGRSNRWLGQVFHLSEPSIRRILSKEKVSYQNMKEIIEQILPAWGIDSKQLLQIYPSAWEAARSYVIKVYHDEKQLKRNIRILEILSDCGIPVAKIIPTKAGEKYMESENLCFLVTRKLPGSNISDIKDRTMAFKMGCAIAQLHKAFLKCEKEIAFWDNSLLDEMKGWIRDTLSAHEWQIVSEKEYSNTTDSLERAYAQLPRQLIHRDVHFGNFLFFEGNLSGYIDFDLTQRNIRIFDICYFLTGLLAEETEEPFTKAEWIESVKSAVSGYETRTPLSWEEKNALPCVMECIEILFVAYFTSTDDIKNAMNAYQVLRFIQNCDLALTSA